MYIREICVLINDGETPFREYQIRMKIDHTEKRIEYDYWWDNHLTDNESDESDKFRDK